jgi:hypothetical protein
MAPTNSGSFFQSETFQLSFDKILLHHMQVFFFLYVLALYTGFLLPIPITIVAWVVAVRGWLNPAKDPGATSGFRFRMSQIGLALCTLGVVLWIYGVIAERGSVWTMNIGIGGSLVAVVVCAFSGGKIKPWLIISAVALLCFFGSFGAGEAI